MTLYYTLLLLLHILLLGYWLGTELGVFYAGYYVTRSDLTAPTRATIARMLVVIELVPRFCLILTFPVGATLALSGGYSTLPPDWTLPSIILIWVFGFAWILLGSIFSRHYSHALLKHVDTIIRSTAIVILVAATLSSAAGYGPIDAQAGWLQAKLILFAAIIATGLLIRQLLHPLRPALSRLIKGEISPEIDSVIEKSVTQARPFIIAIWVGLVIEAYLGNQQAFFNK